ncbi:prominin-like protein isoform X2 [Dendroctonus ponderosae]|uniref:Prominin-like protein n=1 Tax=Dendroctonus ponderosae TaxID=77166 RepID=A0AAR5PLU9_DENPD|nr:prominin-like protein isoform X2 [Dendroctonus ponderosae]
MKGKEWNKRQSVNAVSLSLTCIFLFLAVQLSDGKDSFVSKINEITKNLKQAVGLLDFNVAYTDFVNDATYYSSTEFNAGGMAGLYKLTRLFINVFAPKDILMEGLISIDAGNNINIVENPDFTAITKYYASLVAIVVFLLLCVVLFPLCGLCFCCCRCCGNCGAKALPSDKRRDTSKKVIQAILLIMCTTGLLFCIVCAFASNQQLEDGVQEFPTNLNYSVRDTETFMDTTNAHLRHLLTNNYQEFSTALNNVLQNGTEIAMNQLFEFAGAANLTKLFDFSENLGNVNNTLYELKSDTNRLRVYASQLNDALRKVKRDLTKTLNDCSYLPECSDFKKKIDLLQTNIDFSQVPDVSSTIASLGSLNIANIQNDVDAGQKSLNNIRVSLSDALNKGLNEAKTQLANGQTIITENLDSVTGSVNDVKKQIDSSASNAIKSSQQFIDNNGKYRFYFGVTISCALLSIVVFIFFGLICGVCGKRPDGYSDNCCNKGTGSNFLCCAVAFMFLFGFIISLITLLFLLVGVISERVICDPLSNPDPDQFTLIRLLDDYNLDFGIDVTPSTLLSNCFQNKSIYTTFNLQTKFKLDEIRAKFDISEAMKNLQFNGSIIPDNFTIIDGNTLDNLAKFNPDINSDGFIDELSRNLTNYNLDELSDGLRSVISALPSSRETLKSELELSLLHLNTYNEKLIIPMKNVSQTLVANVLNLTEQLNMGYNTFQEAIEALTEDINHIQDVLRTEGPARLNETAQIFANTTLMIITTYLDRVQDHIEVKIGQCGPLSLVINSTLTSTCDKVLTPWNGFWFSLFWTSILYVITIFVATSLGNLYKKHKPYDQYIETEYLYDAYADRGDNIPLNSRGGKRSKKKGKKSKRYEERPNAGREVARDYAAGSHPPGERYADMAPNNYGGHSFRPDGRPDTNGNFVTSTRF